MSALTSSALIWADGQSGPMHADGPSALMPADRPSAHAGGAF
jgi:hypothetical protein